MENKIWVVIAVTTICLSVLFAAVTASSGVPDSVISLMEKAFLGLFALASGTSVGFALGKKSAEKKKDIPS